MGKIKGLQHLIQMSFAEVPTRRHPV
jgi:hypothetical protein